MSANAGVELRGRTWSAAQGAGQLVRRLSASRRLPLVLLAVLSVASLGARSAWLGLPCDRPCTSVAEHRLIFDENYYVNAARVIAGIEPPPGAHYADAPPGVDPNSEHPPLAKLVIAEAIRLLGDGPWAWRLGSLLMGSLAILGLFALVRAAGGSRWLALGSAALMAGDNLLLVHGRLATLDEYALAPMLWGVAAYLRGRRVTAGVLIAVAACMKEVGAYALLALAAFELLRLVNERGSPWVFGALRQRATAAASRLAVCTGTAVGAFLLLLGALDRLATPFDPVTGRSVRGGPIGHVLHMISYASHQVSPDGPTGISSYPWTWFADFKPIVYSVIGLVNPANRRFVVSPPAHFIGFISPPILLFALPALGVVVWETSRGRADRMGLAGASLLLGTFAPFALASLFLSRTSYLYYMVLVMPGVYVLVAWLFARDWMPRWALVGWMAAVAVSAVVLYPFTPLPYVS